MFGTYVTKVSDVPRRIRIGISIISGRRRNMPRRKMSPRKRNGVPKSTFKATVENHGCETAD